MAGKSANPAETNSRSWGTEPDRSGPDAVVIETIRDVALSGEAARADWGFREGVDRRAGGDQVGELAGGPDRQEAAHRRAGDRTAGAVRQGAKGLVDVRDKLGEVERELADGFDRAGGNDEEVVGGGVSGDLASAVVVRLLVPVEPVKDGVPLLRRIVRGWEDGNVSAPGSHYLARVRHIADRRLVLPGQGKQE